MLFLTVLLSILFTVQYITQSDKVLRRIVTRGRIHAGRLSCNDIVRLTHKMYTGKQYTAYDNLSGRVYKSTNGRLYHVRMLNGHKSIRFVSLQRCIDHVQDTITGVSVIGQFHTHYISWNIPAMAAI